jgi:hypothetical protein
VIRAVLWWVYLFGVAAAIWLVDRWINTATTG